MVRTVAAVMAVLVLPCVGAAIGALIGNATCERDPTPELFEGPCGEVYVGAGVGLVGGLIVGWLVAGMLRRSVRRSSMR